MLSLLPVLAGVLALVALFVVCRWGGTTLATHHNDPSEIGAAALVGLCALAMVAIVTHVELPGGPLALALVGVAMAGGLFAGYARVE